MAISKQKKPTRSKSKILKKQKKQKKQKSRNSHYKSNNKSSSKRKKSKITRKKRKSLKDLKGSDGVDTPKKNWLNFGLFDVLFNQYHIRHQYKNKGKMFAELVIFKEPQKDIRGYIHFYIDGPITFNKVDLDDDSAINRITVGKNDRIVFKTKNDNPKIITLIDYVPDYQREISKNNLGLFKKNKDYGVVSDMRIKDIRDIFSWLQYTADPRYFEDILKKVEISKGVKLSKKEKLEF
jgi:hypothetical protein